MLGALAADCILHGSEAQVGAARKFWMEAARTNPEASNKGILADFLPCRSQRGTKVATNGPKYYTDKAEALALLEISGTARDCTSKKETGNKEGHTEEGHRSRRDKKVGRRLLGDYGLDGHFKEDRRDEELDPRGDENVEKKTKKTKNSKKRDHTGAEARGKPSERVQLGRGQLRPNLPPRGGRPAGWTSRKQEQVKTRGYAKIFPRSFCRSKKKLPYELQAYALVTRSRALRP